jgi:hypothetical protein
MLKASRASARLLCVGADKSMERTRLRNLMMLALILITPGCAHVKILSARVAAIDSKTLVVELATNKDLRNYGKTFYADHVYLSYRPSTTVVSSEFDKPTKPWKFPFSMAFDSSQACAFGQYCSKWTIPIADSSKLDLNNYKYVLRKADSVRMRIEGGTMGPGRLKSNFVVVAVP